MTRGTREPFRFTTGRWFNKLREDGAHVKAPAYRDGFTYAGFSYGQDYPEHYAVPADAPGGLQRSLICSPSTSLLAIDVDHPENLPGSATGQLVSWQDAVSARGGHFHVLVDMRGVSEEDWPAQGQAAWGDIKAAGFVPVPGCVHKSGELYEPAPDWPSKLGAATPELTAALKRDREDHALARLAQARQHLGMAAGTRLPDGAYLYSSGYVGGTWAQLPDLYLCHDDELKDLVWDMGVEYGLGYDEVYAQWCRLAGALGRPWTERDFARHWHRVPARRAAVLERDDSVRLMEDFGLKLPLSPVEAARDQQRREYEERCKAAPSGSGFGPPTAQQPDGPVEDENDGVSWFHWYLGGGRGPRDFDAGPPTDAGNAEAVLYRAQNALRYDEEAGTWLKRIGTRWVQDAGAAKEAVTALGPRIPEGCADPLKHPRYEHLDPEEDAAEIAALKKHGKNGERFATSSVVSSIAAMMENIARARAEPWMTVRDSQVDADPEILWAGGVPWDLKASEHGPVRAWHVNRNSPHLHSAACVPDASVPTPLWDDLMREVWVRPDPGDRSKRVPDPWLAAWAILVLSAGVTGYPKKAVPLLKGGTDTGKSTTIDAVANVLGTYFTPLNSKVLDSGASTHDTVLMELKGARLTFLDEGIQRGKMATARLKRLVGGSSITANRMRQDPVTFRPTHTLAITLNPEENFSFDDPAIDSRMRMLPCDGDPEAVITVAKRFNYYRSQEWLDERPGVLAKLMAAAALLLNDPHAIDKDRAPASAVMAERRAKDEEDEILRWFLEATEDCPDGYPSRPLYLEFKRWTEETRTDRSPVASETRWGRRMNELIPEDAPDSPVALTTPQNSKLRRRRPRQQSPGGFGGFYPGATAAAFMGGDNRAYPTSADLVAKPWSPAAQPAEPADPPGYPPEVFSQVRLSAPVSSVSSVSTSLKERLEQNNPPKSLLEKGTGETHRVTGPTGVPAGGEPVVSHLAVLPENSDLAENAKNAKSPPGVKTPRNRLTDEEKAERAQARKDRLVQERADARKAKIAELGGPLVTLPAVVLRDQTLLECTTAQAAEFLAGTYARMGVDVEHSGFPVGHPLYRLRLVQLGCEAGAVVFDPQDPEQAQAVRDALRAAQVLHAHSALADLTPLVHAGLCDAEVWGKMWDTMVAAKLTDPRMCDSDEVGLKALARRLLGDAYALSWKCDETRRAIFAAGGWLSECEMTTPAERSGWAQIPICEEFVKYAASDVMDCNAIARVLFD